MSELILNGPKDPINTSLKIGGSKSISNRVLLIRALSQSQFEIDNLSNSDDTSTLLKLLENGDQYTYDCHHAGTTFRFLTAYFSLQKGEQILTGSNRMKQRPIGPLVEALISIGADIEYIENDGYPPLRIKSFKNQKSDKIKIKADISSQFISALCMISPVLKKGLKIEFQGELVSKPYLEMTLSIMSTFGITSQFNNNCITINSQSYKSQNYLVESDWSSASYHFAIASLLPGSEIRLNHYFKSSLQGDSAIVYMAEAFGVESNFEGSQLIIRSNFGHQSSFAYNYIKQPDIAQTMAVMGAAKNMNLQFKGLKTLRIKETDRIKALQNELQKVGVSFQKSVDDQYEFENVGKIKINGAKFETYQDHRMAMAFAPLAILGEIKIMNPAVVSKSYPDFWKHLEEMGFVIN
jgi:3-phosphoshikimate 1-carboxyvinyltransferase